PDRLFTVHRNVDKNLLPIIRLENVTKQFPGVLALDHVSMSIYPTEIHAVVGENGAGKSTLMNILAGELQPDSGQIFFQGKPQVIASPFISQRLGISVVYQELALCSNLSIAENISLNSVASRSALGILNKRDFLKDAKSALAQLGMENMNVRQSVGQLSLAQQQMVDIAKALSIKSRVLILDEPNSALTQDESDHLFRVLRQFRGSGGTIIYVSHRLEEVLSLADRITVMRDGKYVDTLPAAEATIDLLISKMVGRAVERLHQREVKNAVRETVILDVRDLNSGRAVQEINLQVRAGEIVGIAGLPDAGRDELVDCLFGLRRCDRGQILINGKPVVVHSPAGAISRGLALIPADRRGAGVMQVMSVQNNIIAANTGVVSRFGIFNRPVARKLSQSYVEQLDIRLYNLSQQMATLSGGNQQKTVVARGLSTKPSVFVLHEPTRGIDVGAKAEIYGILGRLAEQGVGILLISSELPELIGQCDRILVMHGGQIKGDFARSEFSEESILACAMGQMTHGRASTAPVG
ncbi:MAG TPA: sugar ABC transporter ATP-binding protein, partial [Aggregatilineales bacterium]|nr:sugar ABC transporter ATP-binding protein [Aggregatilineales bacterium]